MSRTSAFKVAEMPAAKAVKFIRDGLAASAFDGVAKALSLSEDQLAIKLGVSPRTLRDQRKRTGRLSSENSEKLVRAARVHHLARKIFSTDAAVSQWLASPAPALGGVAPLDILDTDVGTREVESVLQGIAYGNVM